MILALSLLIGGVLFLLPAVVFFCIPLLSRPPRPERLPPPPRVPSDIEDLKKTLRVQVPGFYRDSPFLEIPIVYEEEQTELEIPRPLPKDRKTE